MGYKFGSIINDADEKVIFSCGVKPLGLWARFRGLQWRQCLPDESAWWFEQCGFVHTLGMRFNLDIFHLSRSGVVIRIDRNVPKNKISGSLGTASIIEASSETIHVKNINVGDTLRWVND